MVESTGIGFPSTYASNLTLKGVVVVVVVAHLASRDACEEATRGGWSKKERDDDDRGKERVSEKGSVREAAAGVPGDERFLANRRKSSGGPSPESRGGTTSKSNLNPLALGLCMRSVCTAYPRRWPLPHRVVPRPEVCNGSRSVGRVWQVL